MQNIESSLPPSRVCNISLALLKSALEQLLATAATSARRVRPELYAARSPEELAMEIRNAAQEMRNSEPSLRARLSGLGTLVQKILDAENGADALGCFREAYQYSETVTSVGDGAVRGGYFTEKLGQNGIEISRSNHEFHPGMQSVMEGEVRDLNFLAAVMQMCAEYRRGAAGDRCVVSMASSDILALEHAYLLVDRGARLPRFFKPLRKTAGRTHQTYLSFADPGDGHLKVTVRDSSLLDGTIVHIEWIDRDNVDSKDLVEAYRLSSPRRAARVRLHVGAETPCTAFIGRPVFEARELGQPMDAAQFEMSILKAAHTTAGACSAMFAQGVIDCKVAMDGMTARQAVTFMQAVAGNVVRDPDTQWLSGAFNVNSPMLDDRKNKLQDKIVSAPYEIALLGIELVREGKFDKVAWDGASNEKPSLPIIGRLSRTELLRLVHEAHRRNLETYISAGMVADHMRVAVYLGVGGVGIGTSLHHVADERTKEIGEIDPARVRKALKIRNDAAADDAGKAARKLAELDWQWFQNNLPPPLDELREKLYEELIEFHTECEGMDHRLADIAGKERQGTFSAAEAEERARLQETLADYGKKQPQLHAVLEKIAEIETLGQQRSKGFEDEADAGAVPIDIRRNPTFQRAERIVKAHREGRRLAGPVEPNEQTLAQLDRHLKSGDVEGLRQIVGHLDESVVWESLLE